MSESEPGRGKRPGASFSKFAWAFVMATDERASSLVGTVSRMSGGIECGVEVFHVEHKRRAYWRSTSIRGEEGLNVMT